MRSSAVCEVRLWLRDSVFMGYINDVCVRAGVLVFFTLWPHNVICVWGHSVNAAHAYASCFHPCTRFAVVKVNLPSLLIHCDKVTLSLTAFICLSLPIVILFSSVFSMSFFISVYKRFSLNEESMWAEIWKEMENQQDSENNHVVPNMYDWLLWKTKGEILKNVCAAPFQFNDSERGWTKVKKTSLQLFNISCPFDSCKIFWSCMIALCEEQTEIVYKVSR